MKFTSVAATAALATILTGCASIMSGTTQEVAVVTPPTPGAVCTLSNPEGTWEITTPGTAVVHRSKKDIQIACTKDGWTSAKFAAPSEFENWTLGNLLIGGLVGLTIDASLGSINEYPHLVEVPMMENLAAANPASTAASITPATAVANTTGTQACTHADLVQARIAKMNGYTGGPRCD